MTTTQVTAKTIHETTPNNTKLLVVVRVRNSWIILLPRKKQSTNPQEITQTAIQKMLDLPQE